MPVAKYFTLHVIAILLRVFCFVVYNSNNESFVGPDEKLSFGFLLPPTQYCDPPRSNCSQLLAGTGVPVVVIDAAVISDNATQLNLLFFDLVDR